MILRKKQHLTNICKTKQDENTVRLLRNICRSPLAEGILRHINPDIKSILQELPITTLEATG